MLLLKLLKQHSVLATPSPLEIKAFGSHGVGTAEREQLDSQSKIFFESLPRRNDLWSIAQWQLMVLGVINLSPQKRFHQTPQGHGKPSGMRCALESKPSLPLEATLISLGSLSAGQFILTGLFPGGSAMRLRLKADGNLIDVTRSC